MSATAESSRLEKHAKILDTEPPGDHHHHDHHFPPRDPQLRRPARAETWLESRPTRTPIDSRAARFDPLTGARTASAETLPLPVRRSWEPPVGSGLRGEIAGNSDNHRLNRAENAAGEIA